MESRFCCCGVKVGAITVAYVELVVSLLLGIAACVSLGVAANICDDGSNSSETCDFIKIMLIVVISVTVVRVLLISVGAVCVHVGVKRNNPTWLLPLIIINSATIGFICFDIVSAFARGEDWLSSLGRVIDIALLIFFTYALISCSKFMNQERAMVVMGAEKTGFVITILISVFIWFMAYSMEGNRCIDDRWRKYGYCNDCCDTWKTMLIVDSIIIIIRFIAILVGAIFIHIGVRKKKFNFILPSIVIYCVLIVISVLGVINGFLLSDLVAVGCLIGDLIFLFLFIPVLIVCYKHMKKDAQPTADLGLNGPYEITINHQSNPHYSQPFEQNDQNEIETDSLKI